MFFRIIKLELLRFLRSWSFLITVLVLNSFIFVSTSYQLYVYKGSHAQELRSAGLQLLSTSLYTNDLYFYLLILTPFLVTVMTAHFYRGLQERALLSLFHVRASRGQMWLAHLLLLPVMAAIIYLLTFALDVLYIGIAFPFEEGHNSSGIPFWNQLYSYELNDRLDVMQMFESLTFFTWQLACLLVFVMLWSVFSYGVLRLVKSRTLIVCFAMLVVTVVDVYVGQEHSLLLNLKLRFYTESLTFLKYGLSGLAIAALIVNGLAYYQENKVT